MVLPPNTLRRSVNTQAAATDQSKTSHGKCSLEQHLYHKSLPYAINVGIKA